MSQVKPIPPPITWKPLFNYDLSKLKEDFKIADFERTAKPSHIREIVTAILTNRFYDPVIRVVKDTKPFVVLDAQHRLQALWLAHTQYGLKKYNLMLAIYPEEFARTIYRRLNMGKPLLTRDHSRALDDKKTPFFTELQPWLSHDRTVSKGPYTDMLHALHYAKGARHTVQVRDLDSVLGGITKHDIEIMKNFCQAIKSHFPVVFHALVYRAAIYRNIFKIGHENNFNAVQFGSLINAATSNSKIKQVTAGRKHSDLLVAYKIMVDEILPKIK
jgi:hypothetical protein